MIVEIEDRSIQEIMQVCVKEEIEFLTRNLLRRPEIRNFLWPYVQDQLEVAGKAAGLDRDMVDQMIVEINTLKAPSGGGGGSDPSDDGTGRSGGGGGSDPGDDGTGRSGGGGGEETLMAAAKPAKKK